MITEIFGTPKELLNYSVNVANFTVAEINGAAFGVLTSSIKPLLGTEMVDLLFDTTKLSDTLTAARTLNKTAIANFVAVHIAQKNNVQLGGAGLQSVETDTHKRAYKYDKEQYYSTHNAAAFAALDSLIALIDIVRVDFTEHLPNYYTSFFDPKHRSTLIVTAESVKGLLYDIDLNTLNTLRPFIREAESDILEERIGTAYLEALRAYSNTPDTLKTKLKTLLQIGLLEFAVQKAISKNIVKLQGSLVYSVSFERDDAPSQRKLPDTRLLEMHIEDSRREADFYFAKAYKFLDANATALQYTKPEQAASISINNKTNAVKGWF